MGNSELSPSKLLKSSAPKIDCQDLLLKLFSKTLKLSSDPIKSLEQQQQAKEFLKNFNGFKNVQLFTHDLEEFIYKMLGNCQKPLINGEQFDPFAFKDESEKIDFLCNSYKINSNYQTALNPNITSIQSSEISDTIIKCLIAFLLTPEYFKVNISCPQYSEAQNSINENLIYGKLFTWLLQEFQIYQSIVQRLIGRNKTNNQQIYSGKEIYKILNIVIFKVMNLLGKENKGLENIEQHCKVVRYLDIFIQNDFCFDIFIHHKFFYQENSYQNGIQIIQQTIYGQLLNCGCFPGETST